MNSQIIKKSITIAVLTALTIFFVTDLVSAQDNTLEKLLKEGKLPSKLQLAEKEPQKYLVTTDYFNNDIYGHFQRKERYQGTYARGFADKKVRWSSVTHQIVNEESANFTVGDPLTYMEGFTYSPSAEMMKANAFPNFPPTEVSAKNLVWDMMGFEGFAWLYFDSLKLNIPYAAPAFNGKIPMEGVGTFENKNIILTWTGVTIKNNETCAVIEFLAMDNPLDFNFKTEQFTVSGKGRSHYWGTLLVSLSDKQIEGATLHEDVLLEMVLPGNTKQLSNTTRLITVDKLN